VRRLAFAAAALLTAYAAVLRPRQLRWGATDAECAAQLAGDDLVGSPDLSATRAIGVRASSRDVWPWIAQLGQGRGGFYAYERLERTLRLHPLVVTPPRRASRSNQLRNDPENAENNPRRRTTRVWPEQLGSDPGCAGLTPTCPSVYPSRFRHLGLAPSLGLDAPRLGLSESTFPMPTAVAASASRSVPGPRTRGQARAARARPSSCVAAVKPHAEPALIPMAGLVWTATMGACPGRFGSGG
jgi:hypothetical protein